MTNSITEEEFKEFETKMPFDERVAKVEKLFPSVKSIDLEKVFKADPAILGKIINDVLKQDQAVAGRPGKRPALDRDLAYDSLKRLQGEDYSIRPFQATFAELKGSLSIRNMAIKCNITSTMCQRLLNGSANPTIELMESVAKKFKKDPSYFLEYRVWYVSAVLCNKLMSAPEASIVQYLKMVK